MDCLDGILDNCRRAVGSVDPAAREALIRGILGRRKVFIYGSGRSGLVGQMFAVRLVQLGLDVHFVGEMTTPIIGKEDLTLLISYTGKTSSVVQTAQIARRIGSEIICVTGVQKCPLVNASDVAIVMEVPDGADVRRTAPLGTVFEDSALLLFDCIVSEIMAREGVTEEEMRNRHAIWVRSHSDWTAEASLWPSPSTMYTASSPAGSSTTIRTPVPHSERTAETISSVASVPSEGKNMPTSTFPHPSTILKMPLPSASTFPVRPPFAALPAASKIAANAFGPNTTSTHVPNLPAI